MPRLVIQHSGPQARHVAEEPDGRTTVRGYVSSVAVFRWALSDRLPPLGSSDRAAAERLWRLASIVANVPAGILLDLAAGDASIEYDRENDMVVIDHDQVEADDGERGMEPATATR